jgi:hypothetical protein
MSPKRPQPLPVAREPDVDDVVLGRREEKVALRVEDNLRERTLVALEDDGFLQISSAQTMTVRQ